MKTIIIILALVLLAGCEYIGGSARGINNAMWYDTQLRSRQQPILYPQQQNNNSTYWQEQNARQQYFEANRPQSLFNPDGSARYP